GPKARRTPDAPAGSCRASGGRASRCRPASTATRSGNGFPGRDRAQSGLHHGDAACAYHGKGCTGTRPPTARSPALCSISASASDGRAGPHAAPTSTARAGESSTACSATPPSVGWQAATLASLCTRRPATTMSAIPCGL
nr:hypothetical protein [Tanacetum cinerariifolium]